MAGNSEWEEVPEPSAHSEWEEVPAPPAHEGPGVIKSAVASFLHAIPGSESMAQAEGIPNFNGTVQQSRADHPIASAVGTLGAGAAGAAMGPSSAIVGGLAPALAGTTPDAPNPKAGWMDQAMSGVQAAGAPMLPGLAAAGLTKLGQALPTLTGLGIAGATAAGDGSAYDKAIGIGGGAVMAGMGALGNLGRLVAKPVNAARESVLRDLISEFLPQAEDATKSLNAKNETGFKNRFREALRARSRVPSPDTSAMDAETAAVKARNTDAEAAFKTRFQEAQGAQSKVPSPDTSALDAETAAVKARNAQGIKDTRAYAGLLKRSTSPVGGDQRMPSIPGQPDLQAQAVGKLGAEAQESYRYLRSKDPLGLKLTPQAEQGVGALLPDYEAGANRSLAKFAGGKEARLQELLAELRGTAPTPNQSNANGPPSHLGFFSRPDLLPTSGTLKPNSLAGFTPEPLPTPKPPLPRDLGMSRAFAGIKADPLAGFTPEPLPTPKPPLPRDLGMSRAFAGIKADPLAGFTPEPLPTEEDLSGPLSSSVQPKLDAMRKEQGVASRIASGAGKGMVNGAGGNLTVVGALLGKPKLMVGGGLLGAGKALVNDPVVATTILEPAARALQAAPELGKRLGPFLAGTKGPMLAAKLNYLMQHDKEFKAAVEAQKAGQ